MLNAYIRWLLAFIPAVIGLVDDDDMTSFHYVKWQKDLQHQNHDVKYDNDKPELIGVKLVMFKTTVYFFRNKWNGLKDEI